MQGTIAGIVQEAKIENEITTDVTLRLKRTLKRLGTLRRFLGAMGKTLTIRNLDLPLILLPQYHEQNQQLPQSDDEDEDDESIDKDRKLNKQQIEEMQLMKKKKYINFMINHLNYQSFLNTEEMNTILEENRNIRKSLKKNN